MSEYEIPNGICQCGCGAPTSIARKTDTRVGSIAGQPVRFIRGHVGRIRKPRMSLDSQHWREEQRNFSTPCWIFIKTKPLATGYCMVRVGGRRLLAHRAVYEQLVGSIPEGLLLDHLCRQPSCVNPDHLEPVTHATNLRRGQHAKLSLEKARFIRSSTKTNTELAKLFGVAQSTISQTRLNRLWSEKA